MSTRHGHYHCCSGGNNVLHESAPSSMVVCWPLSFDICLLHKTVIMSAFCTQVQNFGGGGFFPKFIAIKNEDMVAKEKGGQIMSS